MYYIKYKKSVFRSLALISQVGITMLSPVFLCLFVGYQIDKVAKNSYTILICLILGIIAGCNMSYKLIKAVLDKEILEEKLEKKSIESKAKKQTVCKPKIESRVFKREG